MVNGDLRKLVYTVAGGLALTGILGGIYLGQRVSSLETVLEISPTADVLTRLARVESRLDALESGGPRFSTRDAHDLETELRTEIERLRDRVNRLHNHAQ